jgi:stress response protein YsnF
MSTQNAAMGGTGSSFEGSQYGGAQSQGQTNLVIPLQEEKLTVGTRQVNEGGVRLRKIVRTENVSQPVQIRRESITVDRQPASAQGGAAQMSSNPSSDQAGQAAGSAQGAAGLNTPFQEGEMVINLTREEPMVQTQVVPAGNVVVQKRVTTEPVNIQHQVRREEIQASPIGNSRDVSISSNLRSSASNPADNNPGAAAESAAGAGPAVSGQSGGGGSSAAPITDLSQLTSSSNPAQMAGRQVQVSGAKVTQVAGNQLLVVDAGNGTTIFVRSTQPISNITEGQNINLSGSVKPVPQTVSDLGLDPASAQKLQGQQIYLDADQVTPASR